MGSPGSPTAPLVDVYANSVPCSRVPTIARPPLPHGGNGVVEPTAGGGARTITSRSLTSMKPVNGDGAGGGVGSPFQRWETNGNARAGLFPLYAESLKPSVEWEPRKPPHAAAEPPQREPEGECQPVPRTASGSPRDPLLRESRASAHSSWSRNLQPSARLAAESAPQGVGAGHRSMSDVEVSSFHASSTADSDAAWNSTSHPLPRPLSFPSLVLAGHDSTPGGGEDDGAVPHPLHNTSPNTPHLLPQSQESPLQQKATTTLESGRERARMRRSTTPVGQHSISGLKNPPHHLHPSGGIRSFVPPPSPSHTTTTTASYGLVSMPLEEFRIPVEGGDASASSPPHHPPTPNHAHLAGGGSFVRPPFLPGHSAPLHDATAVPHPQQRRSDLTVAIADHSSTTNHVSPKLDSSDTWSALSQPPLPHSSPLAPAEKRIPPFVVSAERGVEAGRRTHNCTPPLCSTAFTSYMNDGEAKEEASLRRTSPAIPGFDWCSSSSSAARYLHAEDMLETPSHCSTPTPLQPNNEHTRCTTSPRSMFTAACKQRTNPSTPPADTRAESSLKLIPSTANTTSVRHDNATLQPQPPQSPHFFSTSPRQNNFVGSHFTALLPDDAVRSPCSASPPPMDEKALRALRGTRSPTAVGGGGSRWPSNDQNTNLSSNSTVLDVLSSRTTAPPPGGFQSCGSLSSTPPAMIAVPTAGLLPHPTMPWKSSQQTTTNSSCATARSVCQQNSATLSATQLHLSEVASPLLVKLPRHGVSPSAHVSAFSDRAPEQEQEPSAPLEPLPPCGAAFDSTSSLDEMMSPSPNFPMGFALNTTSSGGVREAFSGNDGLPMPNSAGAVPLERLPVILLHSEEVQTQTTAAPAEKRAGPHKNPDPSAAMRGKENALEDPPIHSDGPLLENVSRSTPPPLQFLSAASSESSSSVQLSRCKRKQASISRPAFDLARVEEVSRADIEETIRQTEAQSAARCVPMSKINNYIYVGSWRDAHNTELLREHHIEYVLNVAEEVEDNAVSSPVHPLRRTESVASAVHAEETLGSRGRCMDEEERLSCPASPYCSSSYSPSAVAVKGGAEGGLVKNEETTASLVLQQPPRRVAGGRAGSLPRAHSDFLLPPAPFSTSVRSLASGSAPKGLARVPSTVSSSSGVNSLEVTLHGLHHQQLLQEREFRIEWKSVRMRDCHHEDLYERLDEAFAFIRKAEEGYSLALRQRRSDGSPPLEPRTGSTDGCWAAANARSPTSAGLTTESSSTTGEGTTTSHGPVPHQEPLAGVCHPPTLPSTSISTANQGSSLDAMSSEWHVDEPHPPDALHGCSSTPTPYGRILVHCRRGISRSAAIVVAYLMATEGWTYDQALEHVHSRRSCVSLNLAFQEQLQEYHPDPKWRLPPSSTTAAEATSGGLHTAASQKRQRPLTVGGSGSSSSGMDRPPPYTLTEPTCVHSNDAPTPMTLLRTSPFSTASTPLVESSVPQTPVRDTSELSTPAAPLHLQRTLMGFPSGTPLLSKGTSSFSAFQGPPTSSHSHPHVGTPPVLPSVPLAPTGLDSTRRSTVVRTRGTLRVPTQTR